MASGPIISWQIDEEITETVTDFIFLGSKITVDGGCSHKIKRRLLLGRKTMIYVDSILKNRDITLPTGQFSSVQFKSAAQSCLTLCDPMNHSMPGLPVHHHLLEFTQTHIHRVGNANQPSHPLSSPSPPAPNASQHQSFAMSQLFAWGGQSTGVSALASVLPKNTQGWSPSEWTGWISLQSKGLSSSPTPQFRSINSSALSLLHSPTLTSIHDHWKNHSLD